MLNKYVIKDFKIIKHIKFLLKERGLTINGVKKILKHGKNDFLDEDINIGINKRDLDIAKRVKSKIKNISNIIKDLKKLK